VNRIHRRPGVDDDIYDLAAYLITQSEDAARRFVDAVQKTLKDLATMPGMGSLKAFRDPALSNVRSWPVEGFPNHLIFYLMTVDGIDVLAVMHGARQLEFPLKRRI
jgi:plasmid stabilization system protein ParE